MWRLALALALAGCAPELGEPCDEDADCPSPYVCSADRRCAPAAHPEDLCGYPYYYTQYCPDAGVDGGAMTDGGG